MSSITLTLPAESLRDPGVATAAARLLLALGGVEQSVAPAVSAALPQPAAGPAVAAPPKKKRRAPKAQKQMTLVEFAERLPRNSQRFLQILQHRGRATVSELVEMLGLSTAKAIGGITGAIGRWAPVRGIELPYETIVIGGQRAWRWIATDVPDLGDPELPDAPAARAPAVSSVPASVAPVAAAPVAPAAVEAAPEEAPKMDAEGAARLREGLSEKATKLLDLVESSQQVLMAAALDHLGLATARAVAPHFKAIVTLAHQLGLPAPIEQSTTATGERVYQVTGTTIEAPTRPMPPTGGLGGGSSVPGVRIRKRR